jgi:dihydroxy-acid dehydratase
MVVTQELPLAITSCERVTMAAERKTVSAELDDSAWAKRRAVWKKPELRAKGGVLATYARTARPASEGAVTS